MTTAPSADSSTRAAVRRLALRWVQQPLELLATALVQGTVTLLPIAWGSWLGGAIARRIGPLTGRSRIARRELARCFPERDAAWIAAVVADMWENLGRTIFEYAKLAPLMPGAKDGRVELVGAEILDRLRDDGRPGLVVSAHHGNWELVTLALRSRGFAPLHLVYRPANNPWLNAHVRRLQAGSGATLIPKGQRGARAILEALGAGSHLVMLVDQRLTDGLLAPFFGRPAWTAPALAQLSRKFAAPVVPVRVTRLRGADGRFHCRFRVAAEPELALPRTPDRASDLAAGMAVVNAVLERWIREDPAQWLWIHDRWRHAPDPASTPATALHPSPGTAGATGLPHTAD